MNCKKAYIVIVNGSINKSYWDNKLCTYDTIESAEKVKNRINNSNKEAKAIIKPGMIYYETE